MRDITLNIGNSNLAARDSSAKIIDEMDRTKDIIKKLKTAITTFGSNSKESKELIEQLDNGRDKYFELLTKLNIARKIEKKQKSKQSDKKKKANPNKYHNIDQNDNQNKNLALKAYKSASTQYSKPLMIDTLVY